MVESKARPSRPKVVIECDIKILIIFGGYPFPMSLGYVYVFIFVVWTYWDQDWAFLSSSEFGSRVLRTGRGIPQCSTTGFPVTKILVIIMEYIQELD